jgi:hypothetical protein
MRLLKSFNPTDKVKLFEFIYMVAIILLLAAVFFTPLLVRHHLLLVKKYVVQEDVVEVLLIGMLLSTAYLLSNFYKKELKKYRRKTQKLSRDNCDLSNKLTDAFKYIGGVNVQIQEIRSVLCGLSRYPATENEFRNELAFFGRKVLGIVNADWVVIRIIRQKNLRTIKEHFESRKYKHVSIKGISNKAIIDNRKIDGYSIVSTRRENCDVMIVCVFPKKCLNEEEKILIEAVTNQIEMHYLIFVFPRQPREIYLNRKSSRRIESKLAG